MVYFDQPSGLSAQAPRKVPKAIWTIGGTVSKQSHEDGEDSDADGEELNRYIMMHSVTESHLAGEDEAGTRVTEIPFASDSTSTKRLWGCKACAVGMHT